ncbi:polysaccharide biosynthesis protein [Natranaerobius thermophilus]|uniref:Polysaccharide biosynthesis protein CapD n=1 Tax=Natranaerobius thermophilus (strain ATCC BAA-1301 / DSM 18059 / JW/NM-WN-LF) TaxID=457570 RepID=B2A1C2_NATTJ|nr:nucleoside-diphosphate sugar epimerase/dehydratase [Natranaerobius thermophilus]ACB86060.1 polysaccharide biosynthesis protein CapD [Natranaerobius thermophilus JW/NM-WN-LF]
MTAKYIKRGIQVLVDMYLFNLAFIMALLFRFDGFVPEEYLIMYQDSFWWITAVFILTCIVFRLYHRLWSYASIHDVIVLGTAITIGSISVYAATVALDMMFPRSIYLISLFLNLVFLGGYRLGFRVLNIYKRFGLSPLKKQKPKNRKNVLIVGAGDAGNMALKELNQHQLDLSVNIVGFLDDDQEKQGCRVNGVKVLGSTDELVKISKKKDVDEVVIAMPSAPQQVIRYLIKTCSDYSIKTKIIPAVHDLISGRVSINHLREVEIEDLLKRDPIELDINQIAGYLTNKVVLVTGAGGSIGSELVRQIANFNPQTILLLGHGENSIFEIYREMVEKFPKNRLVPIIADVKDREKIFQIAKDYEPDVVFHAAAHKHVPLMEQNPEEAIKNNIYGTKNLVDAAHHHKSQRFVLVSTDKAVNPTSVMGATKRVAELIVENMAQTSETKYTAVRFGNVLGSRGSVIPHFKEQISKGGPVTITHPEMTRYFMTIPEASQLVIEAGGMSKGGEIYVLDMGQPVKIVDLAKDLIKLSGLEPEKDIKLSYTGIRPGEKLYEELLTEKENVSKTKHDKIYITDNTVSDTNEMKKELHAMEEIIAADLTFLEKQLLQESKTGTE